MSKKNKNLEVQGDKPESKKTTISGDAAGSLFKASCWDTCLDVVCAGISAVPADPATGRVSIGTYTGRTDDYTRYTRRLPKLKDFKEWNCDEAGIAFPGLAVVCGAVSRNLCALEFYRACDPDERMWLRFVRLLPDSLWRKLVIEKDQYGYRVYY